MGKVGSFGEGIWASSPAPDDAEALLGALAQNPLAAAVVLLLVAITLALRSGAAPSLSERAASEPAPLQLVFPTLAQASTEKKSRTDKQVRDYPQLAGSSLSGKRAHPLDLRLLGMKSNTSLERGPPLAQALR
jgi:hypothetical protein